MGAIAALACTALLAGVLGGALLFGGGGSTVPFEVEPSLQAGLGGAGDRRRHGDDRREQPARAAEQGRVLHGLARRRGRHAQADVRAVHPARRRLGDRVDHRRLEDAEAVVVNTEQSPGVTAPTSPVLMTATLT